MLTGLIDLGAARDIPSYRQLYGQLRAAILKGRLRAGHRLPATRALAAELGVSRNTVKAAFELLQSEGFIDARRGAGTFVAQIDNDILATALQSSTHRPEAAFRLSAASRHFARLDRSASAAAPRAFQPGLPATDLFPHRTWARLLGRHARSPNLEALAYAFQSAVPELKIAIAAHLRESRGVIAEPEQIIVTSSSQASIDLVVRLLLDPGDPVWMEDPGYLRARTAFIGAGANVVPVAVDAEGLTVPTAAPIPKLIYVTPSHQCPTGVTMSLSRRLLLLDAAASHGATILEDDYDSEIRFGGQPITALQGLGGSDRVIYIGSFAKTMMPSIRAGYLVAPRSLVQLFEAAQRYTGHLLAAPIQAALASFIGEGHYASHTRRMTAIYRERRDALIAELGRAAGDRLRPVVPPGGLQLCATLPNGIDDVALSRTLLQQGVASLPLSRNFAHRPIRGLVLGFAASDRLDIRKGVNQLAKTLAETATRDGGERRGRG